MENVQNNIEPKAVGLVHEILEIIWSTIAAGNSKEAGHVIP